MTQWNLDWYADVGSYANPCTDYAYLTAASTRVARGAYFTLYRVNPSPPQRSYLLPIDRIDGLGFLAAPRVP